MHNLNLTTKLKLSVPLSFLFENKHKQFDINGAVKKMDIKG